MSTQRRNGHAVEAGKGAESRDENGSSRVGKKRDVKDAVSEVGPSFVAASMMLGLIFGGCCSNVYALEAMINYNPSSGTLMTFAQFLFVAVTGYIAQFDRRYPPFFVPPNKVPLTRWVVNIVLFFAINILNNHAFSYNISVPVHIILRSGGSITTMCAGFLYGKRYSRIQVTAVIFLTSGVILAAWSDAQAKNPEEAKSSEPRPAFGMGLVILFVAQALSAIMGLYTEATYAKYGPQWKENLFYSHVLSLPLFLPFANTIYTSFIDMLHSEPFSLPAFITTDSSTIAVPSQVVYLATNIICQYACIRGVNLLAAVSSALTVTIVLNIRKLVSLLLSIWLFGNSLPIGTILGAVVVFGSGALYSLDGKKSNKIPASQKKDEKKDL